jgi:NADP-reducing hydrogenase subunit HndB
MPRLSIDDLKEIREKGLQTLTLRSGEARAKVTVHLGTCGIAAGAREVMGALLDEIELKNITDVIVTTTGCAGSCDREPMVTVELAGQPPVRYLDMKPDRMLRVMKEHILGGRIVADLAQAKEM